jgi:hypothetical protein
MSNYEEMQGLAQNRVLSLTGNESVISKWFAYCIFKGYYPYQNVNGTLLVTIDKSMANVSNYNNHKTICSGNDTYWLIDQNIRHIDQLHNEQLVKHCIQSGNRLEYNGIYLEDLLNFLNLRDIDSTQFYVQVR